MAHTIATFRSMLTRPVTVDEAITAYLSRSPYEADRHAEQIATAEGLLMARLRDLVTILALREAPAPLAMLASALLCDRLPLLTPSTSCVRPYSASACGGRD